MKGFKNKIKMPKEMVFTHFQHKLAVMGFLVTGYMVLFVPYYAVDNKNNKKEEQ